MDRYEKWFIGIILFTLAMLFVFNKVHAGELFRPQEPPEKPVIETPQKPQLKKLKGYRFENSGSYQGQSYLMLPAGLRAESVTVNTVPLTYKKDFQGRQTWFHSGLVNTFTSPIYIAVKSGDIIYSATVVNKPNEPTPPPQNLSSNFHHYNPKAWHGTGSAIVLCNGDIVKSCEINGRRMQEHGSLDKGRQVWSVYGSKGLSGIITCDDRFRFEVKGSGMQFGNCR